MNEAEHRLFILANTAALVLFNENGSPPTITLSQKVLAEHGASLLAAYKETVVQPSMVELAMVATLAERERIAKGLEAEAENSPCAEDASVHRGAAWLVRADFSYEEADRLQTAAEQTVQPVT